MEGLIWIKINNYGYTLHNHDLTRDHLCFFVDIYKEIKIHRLTRGTTITLHIVICIFFYN